MDFSGGGHKLMEAVTQVVTDFGRKLNEADTEKFIDAASQLTTTLKSGQSALEGILGAFGGASAKRRDVLAKGKALALATSKKEAKERGKEFGQSVKALLKDRVVKVVIFSGIAFTAVGIVGSLALYGILKTAIKNGTAAGKPQYSGTPGAAPLLYTLPPAYGSLSKGGNSYAQYSQYG